MKCPQCQKDVMGDRGLMQHIRQSHTKKDGRANREPKVFCGVCGHGLGSMKSLDAHGYTSHHGDHARKEWLKQPTTVDGAKMASAITSEPRQLIPLNGAAAVDEFPGVADAIDRVPTDHGRIFPPREDRNNAETLAGLPWLTFPTTVEQCDDALNGIAIGIERTQIASPFWLSLRAYVTALRKRLAEKVAA